MAVTVNKFLPETHSGDAIYDLFSKLLRIENPGLMGTFHGRCLCPLHLPTTVPENSAKGRTHATRYLPPTSQRISSYQLLLGSMRHAQRLLHALTR